jgi:hypothetical protein
MQTRSLAGGITIDNVVIYLRNGKVVAIKSGGDGGDGSGVKPNDTDE